MKYLISLFLRFVPRKHLHLFSLTAARMLSVFYIGNRVECTICNHRYRSFLPYGRVITRKNALCPNCLSLERHRLMYLYLHRETNFFQEPIKLLHIAPEACFLEVGEKQPNIEYTTADLESPWAKVKMDVHDIPFEDHSFDVIICNHLLEHVDDDIKAMSEMNRVMKPGGWGIMQVPVNGDREVTYEDRSVTDPIEREKHFGQKDHVREYGRDYPERLKKGGFNVEAIDYLRTLGPDMDRRKSLAIGDMPGYADTIFKVSKPARQ